MIRRVQSSDILIIRRLFTISLTYKGIWYKTLSNGHALGLQQWMVEAIHYSKDNYSKDCYRDSYYAHLQLQEVDHIPAPRRHHSSEQVAGSLCQQWGSCDPMNEDHVIPTQHTSISRTSRWHSGWKTSRGCWKKTDYWKYGITISTL